MEQIRIDQTLSVEVEELDNNMPLNKIYKHHHTVKTKHWSGKKKKKGFHNEALYYIT